MPSVVFGLVFVIGLAVAVLAATGRLTQPSPERIARAEARRLERAERAEARRIAPRRIGLVGISQVVCGLGGLLLGWRATGLMGMAVLLGGLGALLPPFMSAPRRRRQQSKMALAWQAWTHQLAELARAGAGLSESLIGSVDHAPSEIMPTVQKVAAAAEIHGVEAALDELAEAGTVWEPEVAAGLRMATTSGGAVAGPLLDLGARINDVVALHRVKTEAVVSLWTQTIALLSLAGGVVLLMYRNNPAYFEPYRASGGQLVLVAIALLLLLSTGFLVHHSVVREENSVLVPARRRRHGKDPL